MAGDEYMFNFLAAIQRNLYQKFLNLALVFSIIFFT